MIQNAGARPQLALVHYAADHIVYDEILFNSPDINAQKIVWAFRFWLESRSRRSRA
jgi:hypothetical protein